MKVSYQKCFYPLILLLLVCTVTPVLAQQWHENSNGWNWGNFTGAYAYVGGYWWGTAYCDPPDYPFYFVWGHYPSDAYWVPDYFGQCGYNYAWTKTTVYWKNAWGQYFVDSQAFAAI